MSCLPIELVILILSFGTEIRYRNGKFMNQLKISDRARETLERIPPIITKITAHSFGRLVNFVCEVKLNNFREIEIWWNEGYEMFYGKCYSCTASTM